MSSAFNPLTEWLGLPPALTSPNYYDLLGLALLESDVGKIAAAADRAMSKVRACKPGAHAAAWAQLLDEISAAKKCLTTADQKRAYDQKLQLGEVLEAASMALGKPLVSGSGEAPSTPPQPASVPPQPTAPVTPQPAPQVAAAPIPNPMDPMAPVPVAAYGVPVPAAGAPQPLPAAPGYPQSIPQAWPASVPQPMPVAAAPAQVPSAMPQPLPTPVPSQPISPAPVPTAQAAPVAAPVLQPATLPQAAPVADPKPAVRSKRSATAMAMQRSNSGVLLPAIIGGGVGMVVLLVVGIVLWMGKSETGNDSVEVAQVQPSPPAPAPKRVSPSELPELPVVPEIAPVGPEPEMSSSPPAVMETTPPVPEPSPTPPTPAPDPEPTASGPTREELRELAQALTTARTAIGEQNFALVDGQLAKAKELAKADEHKEKLRRLTLLSDYVKRFRAAIDQTIAGLEVGSQVPYNDSISFGVVEKGPNLLIVRVAGQNRRYALNELQPGLARRLGEMSLAQGTPETLALQAAFIAVMPKAGDDDLAKVGEWWEQAASVRDVPELIIAISDDYSLRQDLAKVPPDPNAMDQLSGFMTRLKDARTLEEFAKEYQSAIDEGLQKLEPQMEIEVGRGTLVTIDEVEAERIKVQIAGLKRAFRPDDLPLGFAAALADLTVPRDVPLAMVMKAAYFASRDRGKNQFRTQVLAWWEAAGEANPELQPVIQELLKQYPEQP